MARKLGLMKKFSKTMKFVMKPQNLKKILFLVAVLGALWCLRNYIHKNMEGFESSIATFEDDIADGEGEKLVMFYADWCPHCKNLMPAWDEATAEVGEKKMMKIDVGGSSDDEKALMEEHGVSGFPTIMAFEDGAKKAEYNGERTKDAFVAFFKE
jgi:protein disulfide-isomerase-like protein